MFNKPIFVRTALTFIITVMVIIALQALFRFGPQPATMMKYDGAWVEESQSYTFDLKWSKDQAVSLDHKRAAVITPDTPRPKQGVPCTEMVQVKDMETGNVLASLRCGDYFYTWHPVRVAWPWDGLVAIEDQGRILYWHWAFYRFPFGDFWIIIYIIIVIPSVLLIWKPSGPKRILAGSKLIRDAIFQGVVDERLDPDDSDKTRESR